MDLSKIVSISGKPGLYEVIAETDKRIIVESLENRKKKIPVSSNFQVSLLEKITIYTADGTDLYLQDILDNIDNKEGELPVPTGKESSAELRDYFRTVAPKHDENRVYSSDLKKIIKWYHLIKSYIK